MNAKQIGEVIKEARKRKGITKKELFIVPEAMAVIRAAIEKEVEHE